MAILSASELGQSFGARDLFESYAISINRRDRIGLVGPNGCGKTTLLTILAGLSEPTFGNVMRNEDLTLGYLRQEAVLAFSGRENTVYEEMLSVFVDVRALGAQLKILETRMEAGDYSAEILENYATIQEQYDFNGGYQYPIDIKRVLLGLGFPPEEWKTPLAHLSGGQKTRVLLGRLLLEKPDLLILDEPTNHLDMDALDWLERTLRKWEGALLIVSHDRYFLDRVVNQIWEMYSAECRTYNGNYTSFVTQRQERWDREETLFKSEKSRLDAELVFIQKHIAGGKTDIAKGKLKRLTRDIVLIEQVGVLGKEGRSWLEIGGRVRTFSANEAARRIRFLRLPDNRPPRLNIRLQAEETSALAVLQTEDLQVGYGDGVLFSADNIKLERQACAALIGPNGSGKSTLLKTIMGVIEPVDGAIELGDNLQLGYFAQAHEQLTPENRVMDELLDYQSMSEQDARNVLAQYLFRGDDVFKKVSDLSGGERGRLALAILAQTGANFLLLDEPTNHLDIPSQEVLQSVLELFDGTIVLVSHDRYLVDRLATQIWELRDDHLHVFKGTYADFIAAQEANEADNAAEEGPVDLSWLEELREPILFNTPSKWGDDSAEAEADLEGQIVEAEQWLEKLYADRADARRLQDVNRLHALRTEIVSAEAELEQLLAELDDLDY